MNATITIVLVMGLPGSAKTSLCKWILRNEQLDHILNESFDERFFFRKSDKQFYFFHNRIIHLEYDQIVRDLLQHDADGLNSDDDEGASLLLDAWRKSRSIALLQLNQCIQGVMTLLENEHGMKNSVSSSSTEYHELILLDDNFHLTSMRRDVYKSCLHFLHTSELYSKLVQLYDIHLSLHFSTLYLDVPLEICVQRNAFRLGLDRVPEHVIYNMALKLETPTHMTSHTSSLITHKWSSFETHFMILTETDIHPLYHHSDSCESSSSSSVLYSKINHFLQTSRNMSAAIDPSTIHSYFQNKETNNNIGAVRSQSMLHACDLYLRFLVGVTCREDKKLALVANDARRHILDKLKIELNQGMITIQDDMTGDDDDDELDTMVFQRFISYLTTKTNTSPLPQPIHASSSSSSLATTLLNPSDSATHGLNNKLSLSSSSSSSSTLNKHLSVEEKANIIISICRLIRNGCTNHNPFQEKNI